MPAVLGAYIPRNCNLSYGTRRAAILGGAGISARRSGVMAAIFTFRIEPIPTHHIKLARRYTEKGSYLGKRIYANESDCRIVNGNIRLVILPNASL